MPDTHVLRCFGESLPARAVHAIEGRGPRVVYVREGAATIRSGGQVATVASNSAWFGTDACEITAGANGASIIEWHLTVVAAQVWNRSPVLEAKITLDSAEHHLMRCDRVDFPLGGIAYTHTHRGPGIRCLLTGAITVKVTGNEDRVRPGEAWFEAGPDPVLALASESETTSFARVMILPLALRGKSSIKYVLPEDQDKPKRQTYQLFVDDAITI
jgi:quercetin dioxygenase-like cupin family protein